VLCCAVLCCAVLCCAVLCCAVLCCAVLCCAVLCCAVLCCAVQGHYGHSVALINRAEMVMCKGEPLPVDLRIRRGEMTFVVLGGGGRMQFGYGETPPRGEW
jgi:hypothetical protein